MIARMENGGAEDAMEMGPAARAVSEWDIPDDAPHTEILRHSLRVVLEMGYDRPEKLSTIALPGLVATIGKLEAALSEAAERITQLEDALDQMIVILEGLTASKD